MKIFLRLAVFVLLALFAACSGGGGSDDGDSEVDRSSGESTSNFRVISTGLSGRTNSSGIAEVGLTLPTASQAMQVIITTGSAVQLRALSLEKVVSGARSVVVDLTANSRISGASEFQSAPLTFGFPVLNFGGNQVDPGDYILRIEARDVSGRQNPAPGVILGGSLIIKNDSDLRGGTVRVNMIYSGLIAGDPEAQDALDRAISDCRTIATRGGISLDVFKIDFPDGPNTLPNPYSGNGLYEIFANQLEPGINVYVARDVDDLRGRENQIGQSGSIPGPIIPTSRSAVAISIARAAGSDGVFNNDGQRNNRRGRMRRLRGNEKRILGETICHEMFHYMGLFDTVTFSGGNKVLASDLLDSDKCFSQNSCGNNKGANGNIMFPFPLRTDVFDFDRFDSSRTYFPRDRISEGQRTEMNGWIGL